MKRIGLVVAVAACVLGTVVTHARDQQSGGSAAVDVETVGPKVGEAIPDFSLPDQRGQLRSMKSLLGSDGTLLVFFRSADW